MTRDMTVGVIALVPDAWSHIVMPRHQVLKRLASHFPVVWIEPAPGWRDCWLPSSPAFAERDRWFSPVPGLDVLTPGCMHPRFVRPRRLGKLTLRSRLATARRRLVAQGAKQIVLYIWRDEFADALDLVRHDISCYHVDDEYSFDERDVPNSAREMRLLQGVDQVIVHSPALLAKKGRANPHTTLVPNGVDYLSYATPHAPFADLQAVPAPRVGYAGVIKKQLDLALLIRLARARPGYSFVLVGPVLNVAGKEAQIAELKRLGNVFFLGEKPAEHLPAYVQNFDVCLMCYEVNDYTKYVYPLKLNEYLATGRPVVSSPIDAVTGFNAVVTLAGTDAEWLVALDQSLDESACAPARVEARQAFARVHDWNILVDAIAQHLRDALARGEAAPHSRTAKA
jgi:glycosyltransferase involved in cell wall biosynthesis